MEDLLTDALASFFSSGGKEMGTTEWAGIFITAVVTIFMYLLSKTDLAQQRELTEILKNISDLYIKHNADAERLHSLELEMAKNTYSKPEINTRFDEQKQYFDSRFDRIERLLDESRK